eukprot:COSAG05_NODE_10191_length_578_cov_1.290188_1_plen_159_part_10
MPARPFAVKKQTVVLRVDTDACLVQGYTELVIKPGSTDIKDLKLHCRQLKVLNVKVDDHTAKFKHEDPLAQSIVPESVLAGQDASGQDLDGKVTVEHFGEYYMKALVKSEAGELVISMPPILFAEEEIKVRVDFVLSGKTGQSEGARFVEFREGAPMPP